MNAGRIKLVYTSGWWAPNNGTQHIHRNVTVLRAYGGGQEKTHTAGWTLPLLVPSVVSL